jgi:hypothetical protein
VDHDADTPEVRNIVGSVAGTSDDGHVAQPLPAGRAPCGDGSTSNHKQQRRGLERSPEPLTVSTAPPAGQGKSFPVSRRELKCAGSSCQQGLGCPRHPNLSTIIYRRYRRDRDSSVDTDSALCHPCALPSETAKTEQSGCSVPREAACSAETVDDEECLSLARSGSGEGSLLRDEADAFDLANSKSQVQMHTDVGVARA